MRNTVLLLFIVTIFSNEIFSQNKQNNQILSSENGRFVFGQISDFRKDQFLLDTQTGRLWQIVVTEDKQLMLQPVLFTSIDGTQTITPEDPNIQLERLQEIWDKNNAEKNDSKK